MSNGKRQILLQPAHDALVKLLGDLDKVHVESVPAPRVENPRQRTATAWVAALQDAEVGLREWCGSKGANGFMIEAQSKK